MARRPSKQKRKSVEEHTHLAVRTERYEASVNASVNHAVHSPQYAWNMRDDDPLYLFETRLEISGTSIYPDERAGETYELTLYGDDRPSQRLDATLGDAHVRGAHGGPQYRTYRGRQVPVYDPPKGLGHLNKVRGEPRWTVWLFVRPRFVSEMLTLLGHGRQFYLTIHERRIVRDRWVQGLTLQTTNPDEE